MTPQELRAWRGTHTFTPKDLATTLGVTRKTVYRWENGEIALPDDIVARLLEALTKRDTAIPAVHLAADDSVFDLDTEQPHGTVIGLTRYFWREMIDNERKTWIEEAANPLLALPWPHWSHGWEWYPARPLIKTGPLPKAQPHWMQKTSVSQVIYRMTQFEGPDREKLVKAVLWLCRLDKPNWHNDTGLVPFTKAAYDKLHEAMQK